MMNGREFFDYQVALIRGLGPGWCGDDSAPPDPEGLDWFCGLWSERFPLDAPHPGLISPMDDQTLVLSWHAGKFYLDLDVDLANRVVFASETVLTEDEDHQPASLALRTPEDWDALVAKVRGMFG